MSIRQLALRFFIVSIVVAAFAAIAALVDNSMTNIQGRILVAAMVVAADSILSMMCGACWEAGKARKVAATGFTCGLVGCGMMLYFVIVTPVMWNDPMTELFWHINSSAWIVGIACSHACLLSLARLGRSYQWVLLGTFVVIFTLALQCLAAAWLPRYDAGQLVGINAVLVAAGTLLVPVLHKLSESETHQATSGHLTCPKCGLASNGPLGKQACSTCGTRYQVTLLP